MASEQVDLLDRNVPLLGGSIVSKEHKNTTEPRKLDMIGDQVGTLGPSRSSTTADVPKNRKISSFLELPRELRDNIYEKVLVFAEPIELAPFGGEFEQWQHGISERPNVYQYRHAHRFRNEICPCLRLFRVCKQIYMEACGVYYSENAFRFSNRMGWDAMVRFLALIGTHNSSLLRDVTVVDPISGQQSVPIYEGHDAHHQLLVSFGMISPGSEVRPWDHDKRTSEVLRLMPGLRELTFVLYYDEDYFSPQGSAMRSILQAVKCLLDDHSAPWRQQPRMQINITHLYPSYSRSDLYCRPSFVRNVDLRLVRASPGFHLVGAIEEARYAYSEALDRGWKVMEIDYAESCGHFPFRQNDRDLHQEPCTLCADDAQDFMDREEFVEHYRSWIGAVIASGVGASVTVGADVFVKMVETGR